MTLHLKNLILNERQICDLELLLSGAFNPLKTFMGQKDYESVIKDMRLASGDLWPMPITLDITAKQNNDVKVGSEIALRDHEGFLIATLTITEIWKADKEKEAKLVYGTNDIHHPGVNYLYNHVGDYYLGGDLELSELPKHYDYQLLRHTPDALKKQLAGPPQFKLGDLIQWITSKPFFMASVVFFNLAFIFINYVTI